MKRVGLIAAGVVPGCLVGFVEFGESPILVRMAAVAVMMSILWVTEAIPLAATALLPLILFPLLGIASGKVVAGQYMNSTVFLLVGGFMIALAMQRWNLHKRIALTILARVGTQPTRLMLGFIVATASLSMWISNTATTLVMLPIALAILSRFEQTISADEARRFSIGLLLAIAYSASIGGMMTPVGTAPNMVFLRVYEIGNEGVEAIGFAQWMLMATPIGVLMLAATAFYLGMRFIRKIPASAAIDQVVSEERQRLGPVRYEEKVVLVVFAITALLWITRKDLLLGTVVFPGWQQMIVFGSLFDDGTIAIGMSLLLFLMPARNRDGTRTRILDEAVFSQLPWPVVILFGGGFALAYGFVESGLSGYLAGRLQGLEHAGLVPMIAAVTAGMTFLTELTSNTATTQLVLPILKSVAEAMNLSSLWLMLPATLAASCAFMFPVATPPNAIIFGSGKLHVIDMVKTGLVLNLAGIVIIAAVILFVVPSLFGIGE